MLHENSACINRVSNQETLSFVFTKSQMEKLWKNGVYTEFSEEFILGKK